MINVLLSFSLCSGLLLAVYHLLLKSKTLYNFNRYYLLFSLLFSMAVPFISIKTNVAAINAIKPVEENIILLPATEQQQTAMQIPQPVHQHTPAVHIVHQSINYWQYGVWALYIAVALLLFIRFLYNLYKVSIAIKEGRQLQYNEARLILTTGVLTPHTFLRYIFLNRDEYQNQAIDPAILKHELAHARQYHTLDIIFIELLQVFCWFNPFILFYRKAIELNHEFIADAAAVDHAANVASYQYLLLNTASYSAGLNLTSQFNYLTIKKRLIMMNRSTSAAGALWAKAAIVPALIAAFLLFCAKTEALTNSPLAKEAESNKVMKTVSRKDTVPKKPVKKYPKPVVAFSNYPHTTTGVSADELKTYQQIIDKYMTPDSAFISPLKIADEDKAKLESIFKNMSIAQQTQQKIGFYYPGPPIPPKAPSQDDLDVWKNPHRCGIWIDGKKTENAKLNNYKPSDFGLAVSSRLMPTAINYKYYKYQVDLYTTAYYAKLYKQEMAEMHTSHMFFRVKKRPNV